MTAGTHPPPPGAATTDGTGADGGQLDCSIRVVRQAVVETTSDFVGGTLRHSNGGTLDIPVVFTLISAPIDGAVGHILVDCGIGPQPRTGGRPAPRHWVSPGRFLRGVGIDPAGLRWLLLTHLHRDHAGNLDDFPGVRVGLQRRELAGWQQALTLPARHLPFGEASWAHRAISPDTVAFLQHQATGGGCVLFDGDHQLAPGLAVELAEDSHTFGSQLVTVTTADGPYLIGGDNVFCYANIREMWPASAGQGNQFNVLRVLARVADTVGDQLDRVVPGHDMAVFSPHRTCQVAGVPVAELRVGSWDRPWREQAPRPQEGSVRT